MARFTNAAQLADFAEGDAPKGVFAPRSTAAQSMRPFANPKATILQRNISMENLKPVTLALLIPVALLLPKSAAAYPAPADHIKIAGEHVVAAHCMPKQVRRPDLTEQNKHSGALPEPLAALIGPTFTTPLHQYRDTQSTPSPLVLDLVETN
ncbi:MAG: hypothetical protein ABJL99_14485 [Aliishimia sp.]